MRALGFLILILSSVSLSSAGYGGYGHYVSTIVEHCSNHAEIVLVVDGSGSISAEDWEDINQFLLRLVDTLNGEDVYIGIVVYSGCAKVVRGLSAVVDLDSVRNLIYGMEHKGGMTNTYKGISTANDLFKGTGRDNVGHYMIVMSDGQSNRDCDKTVSYANKVKDSGVTILSVGVSDAGLSGTAGYREMRAISSDGNVISVNSYHDLSDNVIDVICKQFEVIEGHPCGRGTPDAEVMCGVLRCTYTNGGYYWKRLYSGCRSADGNDCYDWGESITYDDDCNKYECTRDGCGSGDALCSGYKIVVDKVGCDDDYGSCVYEGEERSDPDTCTTETCTRVDSPDGPKGIWQVTRQKCLRNGNCYGAGDSYTKNCHTYKCNTAGYYYPTKQECVYNGECVAEGKTVQYECVVYECKFIDSTETFDMVPVDQLCRECDGTCRAVGEVWKHDSKCITYTCVAVEGGVKIVEQLSGCRYSVNSDCTPVHGKTNKVNNTCIEYKCLPNGEFDLISGRCIDRNGKCRAHGEVWRYDGECYRSRCVVYNTVPVSTTIETLNDCLIEGQCVYRGDRYTSGCTIYRCSEQGVTTVVSRACKYEYSNECINVNSQPFIDEKLCKIVTCVSGPDGPVIVTQEYGCIFEGRCYAPGATKRDKRGCIIRRCDGNLHQFFPINCAVSKSQCIADGESYLSKKDCSSVRCQISSTPPGAELVDEWTGCVYKGKCYEIGDTRGECTVFRCDGNNQWTVVSVGCLTKDGECRPGGSTWEDLYECKTYQCKVNAEGTAATIVVIVYGCDSREDCIGHGNYYDRDLCTKFKCVNGSLVEVSIGCELPDGTCLGVGMKKDDRANCVQYECKRMRGGKASIETELISRPGCRDGDNRCVFVGETLAIQCKLMICKDPSKGLQVLKIIGCIDENGICKKVGSKWVNEMDCTMSICLKNGQIKSTVIGCIDSYDNDKCVRYNGRMSSGSQQCTVHYCKRVGGKPKRVVVASGCLYNGQCLKFGESFKDTTTCTVYTCIRKKNEAQLVDKLYGCVSAIDGQCYAYGESEYEPDNNCVKYTCSRQKGTFVVASAQCSYEGSCYRLKQTWVDEYSCTYYVCTQESTSTYRVNMINKEQDGCKRDDGDCVPEGGSYNPGNCTEYICVGGEWKIKTLRCEYGDGKCKNIGDKWEEQKGCITKECKKINDYNAEVVTSETGCIDGKKCVEEGDSYTVKCIEYQCVNNEMVITSKGCSYGGKCKDIGDSWEGKNCITYTCVLVSQTANQVVTTIEEVKGCNYKGTCYNAGDTRDEGCVVMVCLDDGSWGIDVFKCTAPDGKTCIGADGTYTDTKTCTVYGCDLVQKSLYAIDYGCYYNGNCVKVDYGWTVEAECKAYKCVYNPATESASLEVEEIGCYGDGYCIAYGSKRTETCNTYTCVAGELIPTQGGCMLESGKCLYAGSDYWDGCTQYKCVITSQTATSMTTTLEVIQGCMDCFGKCRKSDVTFVHGCITQQCQTGGKLVTIDIQCLDESTGDCVNIDKIIIVAGTKKKCTSHGSFTVIQRPTGCEMKNGGKVPPGGTYMDDTNCNTYTCEIDGYSAKWTVSAYGCVYNGRCLDVGESDFDAVACVDYKCTSARSGSSSYASLVKQKGCKSATGVCYRIGSSTWEENCVTYQCVQAGQYGSKKDEISRKCKSLVTDACYGETQTWTEQYNGKCYLFTCKVAYSSYSTSIVRQLCRGADGTCRQIGDSYYDCDVNGQVKSGCECNAKKRLSYESYAEPLSYSEPEYNVPEYEASAEVEYGYGGADYGSYGGYEPAAEGESEGGYGYGAADYGSYGGYEPAAEGESEGGYGYGAADYGSYGGYEPAAEGESEGGYGYGAADYGSYGGYEPAAEGESEGGYGYGAADYGSYGGYEPAAEGESEGGYGYGAADYGSYGGYEPAAEGESEGGYGYGAADYGSYGGYEPAAEGESEGGYGYGGYEPAAEGESEGGYGYGAADYGSYGGYEPAAEGESEGGYGYGAADYGSYGGYEPAAEGESEGGYGYGAADYGSYGGYEPAAEGESEGGYGYGGYEPAAEGESEGGYGYGAADYGSYGGYEPAAEGESEGGYGYGAADYGSYGGYEPAAEGESEGGYGYGDADYGSYGGYEPAAEGESEGGYGYGGEDYGSYGGYGNAPEPEAQYETSYVSNDYGAPESTVPEGESYNGEPESYANEYSSYGGNDYGDGGYSDGGYGGDSYSDGGYSDGGYGASYGEDDSGYGGNDGGYGGSYGGDDGGYGGNDGGYGGSYGGDDSGYGGNDGGYGGSYGGDDSGYGGDDGGYGGNDGGYGGNDGGYGGSYGGDDSGYGGDDGGYGGNDGGYGGNDGGYGGSYGGDDGGYGGENSGYGGNDGGYGGNDGGYGGNDGGYGGNDGGYGGNDGGYGGNDGGYGGNDGGYGGNDGGYGGNDGGYGGNDGGYGGNDGGYGGNDGGYGGNDGGYGGNDGGYGGNDGGYGGNDGGYGGNDGGYGGNDGGYGGNDGGYGGSYGGDDSSYGGNDGGYGASYGGDDSGYDAGYGEGDSGYGYDAYDPADTSDHSYEDFSYYDDSSDEYGGY